MLDGVLARLLPDRMSAPPRRPGCGAPGPVPVATVDKLGAEQRVHRVEEFCPVIADDDIGPPRGQLVLDCAPRRRTYGSTLAPTGSPLPFLCDLAHFALKLADEGGDRVCCYASIILLYQLFCSLMRASKHLVALIPEFYLWHRLGNGGRRAPVVDASKTFWTPMEGLPIRKFCCLSQSHI
jgi:hypothetical protein